MYLNRWWKHVCLRYCLFCALLIDFGASSSQSVCWRKSDTMHSLACINSLCKLPHFTTNKTRKSDKFCLFCAGIVLWPGMGILGMYFVYSRSYVFFGSFLEYNFKIIFDMAWHKIKKKKYFQFWHQNCKILYKCFQIY